MAPGCRRAAPVASSHAAYIACRASRPASWRQARCRSAASGTPTRGHHRGAARSPGSGRHRARHDCGPCTARAAAFPPATRGPGETLSHRCAHWRNRGRPVGQRFRLMGHQLVILLLGLGDASASAAHSTCRSRGPGAPWAVAVARPGQPFRCRWLIGSCLRGIAITTRDGQQGAETRDLLTGQRGPRRACAR